MLPVSASPTCWRKTGDTAGAIEQYSYVVGMKPEYIAARKALAGLYLKANQPEMALVQLREAAKQETGNASLWEQIGDAEKSLNHPDAATRSIRYGAETSNQKAAPKTNPCQNGFLMDGVNVRHQVLGRARIHSHSSD